MKKRMLLLSIAMLAIGFCINDIAKSGNIPVNVAVIDVNAVVNKSSEVQALKKEQKQKLDDLQKWLKTVRNDIEKQQTQEKKDKLIKKYDTEFQKKKEAIAKNYNIKLKEIDKNISQTIAAEAQKEGYSLVLTKGVVLYGGDDITNAVIKAIK